MTNKTENKADVSLDSTLNASDLSVDVPTEPSNDSADCIESSGNSEETGIIKHLFNIAFLIHLHQNLYRNNMTCLEIDI